jgi:hypothetical protein
VQAPLDVRGGAVVATALHAIEAVETASVPSSRTASVRFVRAIVSIDNHQLNRYM